MLVLWRLLAALAVGAALAAIGVVLAAQLWQRPGDLGTLWWLITIGVGFAVVAHLALGWPDEDDGRPPTLPSGDRPSRVAIGSLRLPASAIFVAGALLAEVGCLMLFGSGRLLSIAWLLHVVAAGVLVYGFWRASPPADRRLVPNWGGADGLWLAIIVAAGLLVRIWRIDAIPEGIWFDEAQRGLEVLRMLAESTYRPIFARGVLQEPTGLWYLMMPVVSWLGRDPLALRLPVALGGGLGVAAIFLLGRVMYGRRVAVVASGLAVALTWHLNFSRIALPAVLSLTFDTLAAAFFVAGVRRASRFLLGMAGVLCGAGLYFYYTSQLMPIVLAVAVGQQVVAGRFRTVRRSIPAVGFLALGFVVTAGPFLYVAATDWPRFSARADAVSVFKEVDSAGSYDPLIANLQAHLLMFHVRGDPNGRHNWSGRPMLDPVTGGLAVLGLALAMSRAWRVEQTLVLVWVAVALAGGIFSITWEAPQSHRSISAIVPAVLLAGLPLAMLWQAGDRGFLSLPATTTWALARRRVLQLAPTFTVVAVLLAAGVANLDRFFNRQMRDGRTWMEFATPQTSVGRQLAAIPSDIKIYLEPSWVGHPSIRFVDRIQREYAPFDPATQPPVVDSSAAIFIGDRPGVADRIAGLYPSAIRSYTRSPDSGHPSGYGFILTSGVLVTTRGVAARYEGPAGTVERRDPTIFFNWPAGTPMAAPFAASWSATLTVPAFNVYRLRLEGPPSVLLTLDGRKILTGGAEGLIRLARGNHALRLAGTELGSEPVRLLWAVQPERLRPVPANLLNSAPVQTTGLLGRVYRGAEPVGEAVVEQVDPNVELTVHFLPAPRPYTIEWTGSVHAAREGWYRFGVASLGTSVIWIDGVQVAANSTPGGSADGEVRLERGWHDLRIRFVDSLSYSHVTAFWQPPDGDRETIPTTVLRPWPADRIVAARPEDANLPPPPRPVADTTALRVVPIVPPETTRTRRSLGDGQAVGTSATIRQPRGIAIGPDGTVYAADAARQAMVSLAPDGSSRLLGEGKLKEPSAVAVVGDGLVVVDAGSGTVSRLKLNGQLGERMFRDYQLYGPRGVSVGSAGEVVVADTGNNRLLVGRPDGTVQVVSGLSQPTGGVLLADGTLVAVETGANRVVHLHANGTRLASWVMPPSATVIGPHIAPLPHGGWAVSLPEGRAILARPAGAQAPTLWMVDATVNKPSGLAIGPSTIYVADVVRGGIRAFPLP